MENCVSAEEEENMLPTQTDINKDLKSKDKTRKSRYVREIMTALNQYWLLIFTVVGVVFGGLIGFGLRRLHLSVETRMILTFPGEIFMRSLKMLILPLITSSLVLGLAELDAKSSGQMGFYALTYYFTSTILAAALGIVLVVSIKPGNTAHMDRNSSSIKSMDISSHRNVSTLDSVMDLFRNMFPENLVQACIQQMHTVRIFKNETIVENGIQTNRTELKLTGFDQLTQDQTNFLGLIVFCIAFGLSIAKMGENAKVMLELFRILNEIIMKLVRIVMWWSPIGIFSLVMGKVMEISDFQALVKMLGMYALCVLSGLAIHSLITLPAIYFVVTRKNAYVLYRGVLQAWITAIGTASSAATLPVTFDCLHRMGIHQTVTNFVLPIGATVNMDGTALYEAVAPVFIAQMNGIKLSFGQLIIVSLTATVASVGAASIPSAGLVTMLLVMSAVGLPGEEIMVIMSIDWMLDRIRTSINVLGDCIGCGIVEHLTRSKIERRPTTFTISASKENAVTDAAQ